MAREWMVIHAQGMVGKVPNRVWGLLLRFTEEEGGHFAEAATPSEELVGGAL